MLVATYKAGQVRQTELLTEDPESVTQRLEVEFRQGLLTFFQASGCECGVADEYQEHTQDRYFMQFHLQVPVKKTDSLYHNARLIPFPASSTGKDAKHKRNQEQSGYITQQMTGFMAVANSLRCHDGCVHYAGPDGKRDQAFVF